MMARFLFPDEPFIFRVVAPGSPLYSTTDDPLVIYQDAGATTLADCLHADLTPIYNSALMLDGTAVIPSFYGPDGVTSLWAKQPEGELFQLTAASGPRLDSLESKFVAQGVVYSHTLGAVTANIPVTVTHNLNNPFPLAQAYQISTPNASGVRISDASINLASLSPNSLSVTFSNSYTAGTIQITVVG